MEERPKKPQKGLLYYYGIVLLGILLFNSLIAPILVENAIEQVGYNQFLTDVESGAVSEIELSGEEIFYRYKGADDRLTMRATGAMNDPKLVDRLQAHGEISYQKIVPRELSPLAKFLTAWVLPFLLLMGIGQFFASRMQKRMGGGNAMTFGKSNAKVYVKAQTGITFANVAGQNEAKEAMSEIVDFLHNPQKYTDIGATLPKGALLVGPPGTGKTLMAKAVAGEADVPFFSISGSEFVEMFVGMGAAKVRDLFKQANEKAPCIVFIDEIDTIGKKRDNGGMGGNDEREQTLNQLLTEMDGFDGQKGVVILAATNRPESLDAALLRPGRFDRRIPLELPDLPGREAILTVHSKRVKMEESVDLNTIARATSGASGAELANIINEAALRAVRMERSFITQSDLEESVEVIIAGYQRKNSMISEKEKRIVAYHEIGHALVAAKQSGTAPVHKITIVPRTSGALGYTMQVEQGEKLLMSKTEALQKICTYTGGRAAEELVFDSITSGASNDIEQATKIARMMVARLGMSETFGMTAFETVQNQYLGGDAALSCSPETAREIDMQIVAIIGEQYKIAKAILAENEEKLHELSGYLLEKETITGEEFMSILEEK